MVAAARAVAELEARGTGSGKAQATEVEAAQVASIHWLRVSRRRPGSLARQDVSARWFIADDS